MIIEWRGHRYFFRECDTRGLAQEEVTRRANESGRMQYEPNGFVWLVIPGIGYGREDY